MAERIQLRRSKGWRKPEGAIVVSRPSRWGNPWAVDAAQATTPATNQYRATHAEAVEPYTSWVLYAAPFSVADVRRELAGRDLACWCPLDAACHADVLLSIANASLQEEQPTHIVGAGGWRACDTAADWAGSDTTGVTCAECLATTTDALQEEQECRAEQEGQQ